MNEYLISRDRDVHPNGQFPAGFPWTIHRGASEATMPIYRNWKDPSEYDFTEKLSLLRWAWEFLRRNAEYQKDWLDEMKNYFSGTEIHEQIEFYKNVERRDVVKDRTFCINDPRFALSPYTDVYVKKYGIYYLPNPTQDRPFSNPFLRTPRTLTQSCALPDLAIRDRKTDQEKYRSILFDLDLPLTPQIKHAKQLLVELQKSRESKGGDKTVFRFHKDNWKIYLRIIDAQYSNEKPSISKIASVIYKGEKNEHPDFAASDKVKKNRKAVMELVKSGYKEIAKAGLIEPWGK